MYVELDGNLLMDPETAHPHLKDSFDFPAYYGMNLDALYDCLTDINEDTQVVILVPDSPLWEDNEYSSRIIETLQDAAEVNPCIMLSLE